ncbi:hypothetical protein K469DRAFT_703823 [Zopfia rhizophila CBS 207.26]|uniref:DUF6594 domain-containing protein n=1 Tax=Zopfia rhizophila CBS 207.26 TaxID=1314779 RepID=A0A6A6E8M1_9PEZI|nr:hypothetical protein K469DRAFT_703823 [Zopfia rhizophila CBS 207.26]
MAAAEIPRPDPAKDAINAQRSESLSDQEKKPTKVKTTLLLDIEKAIPSSHPSWQTYPAGYSRFAAFLTADPNGSCTMFRRFDRVNARNLLVLESEISELEAKLDGLESRSRGWSLRAGLKNWELLKSQAEVEEGALGDIAREIVDCTLELREKIKEYYEAVLRTTEMMALARPNKRALQATRRTFLRKKNMDPGNEMISGPMAQRLSSENEADLSILASPSNPDPLTQLFEEMFTCLFRESANGRSLPIIPHRKISFVVSLINTLCAVIFLVGAVVGLYFVSDTKARLAMLSAFTVAFAAVIALLTNARRQEIFVATAAYAAVLVVFVSGNFAANPAPTVCKLENSNVVSTNTALSDNDHATATITEMETVFRSVQTVVSTVVSEVTTTPTAVVRKAELSTFAKTGIGVGASVGALFCLMVLGCGVWPWVNKRMKQKGWIGSE